MGKRSAAGLLTSVDSIFTTQEERDNAQRSYVIDLPAAQISDFPDHPFKVRMDESMMELADSVKQHGILVPSLVRPMPDGSYQMVSGHRRKRAAELAGLPQIQGDILDNVSRYVKPGGVLLYSTCTLLQAENEDVVTAFLAKHPDYQLERFPLPGPLGEVAAGQCILWPQRLQTDGFFLAKLRKEGAK